jgi:hypothetical protein
LPGANYYGLDVLVALGRGVNTPQDNPRCTLVSASKELILITRYEDYNNPEVKVKISL